MPTNHFNISGLTDAQAILARKKHGQNKLNYKKGNSFWEATVRIIKETMMILLLTAASIYFISGKIGDRIFLTVAIVIQTSISLFQYSRSKNALEKLKKFSEPTCKVIRNGNIESIKSEDLVFGDSILI